MSTASALIKRTEELTLSDWTPEKEMFYKRLGNYIQYFQSDLPLSAEGLPMKYIDPTIMAQHMALISDPDELTDTELLESIVDIDFSEGFPTVDGTPFWERLDGELVEFYKLFKAYRDMKDSTGTRAIAQLSDLCGIPGKVLSSISKTYLWPLRCKAYDIFSYQVKEMRRQKAIEDLEVNHSSIANQLLEQSMTYLENHPEQLTPKVAIQMVQLGLKTGRTALGLSAEGGASKGSNETNIQINTQANAQAEGGANVLDKMENQAKDTSYTASILHILGNSGALTAEQEAAEAKAKKEALEAEILD